MPFFYDQHRNNCCYYDADGWDVVRADVAVVGYCDNDVDIDEDLYFHDVEISLLSI